MTFRDRPVANDDLSDRPRRVRRMPKPTSDPKRSETERERTRTRRAERAAKRSRAAAAGGGA